MDNMLIGVFFLVVFVVVVLDGFGGGVAFFDPLGEVFVLVGKPVLLHQPVEVGTVDVAEGFTLVLAEGHEVS